MNNKSIAAIVVVVIVIIAAAAVAITQMGGNGNSNTDNGVSVVARVNTDGSGIFLKASEDVSNYMTAVDSDPGDGFYFEVDGQGYVFNADYWEGKVFGTPGAATIQHVQLNQIVDAMGFEFEQYVAGQTPAANTVYYIPGVNTYQMFESQLVNNPAMVGAFVWEAQYSVALSDNCKGLAVTNDMFPGHTCCIIGAQNSYITTHQDETVRFLAAYVESVKNMTAAIANHVEGEKDELMQIAMNNVTMPMDMTEAEKIEAIESAFDIVVYRYADVDTAANPLEQLTADMAQLAEDFYASGQVRYDAEGMGFDSYEQYASELVQGQYMHDALNYEKQDSYTTANITVAVLAGDIHQLAIHYGMATGIFADYGINITISNQSAGPAAFTAMANGAAQFAFLGAPPMTINAINGGYITPDN